MRFVGFNNDWSLLNFGDMFSYERPDAYIVISDKYSNYYNTPVLTANKGFILGYTVENRTCEYPRIIFDDFTLDSKYVDFPFMVKSSAIKILHANEGIDLRFAYECLQNSKIENMGHARHYISVVQNTATYAPSLSEQVKIGSYFTQLDTLITLHQRKYEKLVNLKKAMLDKMFPKNGELVPEVRFAGFSGNWELCRLGEIVNRVVRKNTDNASSLALTISAQHGLVDQGNYFNNRVASQDVSNYYLIRKGEFAYNKSSSDGSPFGVVKRLDLYDMGVLSTLYIVFDIKDPNSVNTDYLSVFFDANRWHKEVSTRASEGARNHGLLNISATDFLDIEINVPREYDEQEKLGVFFMKLAHLIDRYEQGLMSLRNLKSAFLEKMFV